MSNSDYKKKTDKLKWMLPSLLVIYLFVALLGVLSHNSSNNYHNGALIVSMLYLVPLVVLYNLDDYNGFQITNIVLYCLIFLYGSYIVYDNRSYFIKK